MGAGEIVTRVPNIPSLVPSPTSVPLTKSVTASQLMTK